MKKRWLIRGSSNKDRELFVISYTLRTGLSLLLRFTWLTSYLSAEPVSLNLANNLRSYGSFNKACAVSMAGICHINKKCTYIYIKLCHQFSKRYMNIDEYCPYPARMGKWVPYGQNQGMMPKLDPCGSHIGILAHVGPT